jgi:DNA polymerase-3 subunit delta
VAAPGGRAEHRRAARSALTSAIDVPAFKAAYLIHGDDHGRIAERRSRLRAVAEAESGSAGVEVFEGDACTPELVANALNAMTFAVGRRFVIADGIERWKDAEVAPLVEALAAIDPDALTVAFFAREEGRAKAPAALVKAVAAAGVVQVESTVKGRELPRWVQARAQELGLKLDHGAARALIARVGDRQQRLLRELEKITIELGPDAQPSAEQVDELVAGSSERKTWTLADAVVAGDKPAALRAYVELRGQGERVTGLLFAIVRRMRDAYDVASALERGESPAQIKGGLRMPPFAADRLIEDVRRHDAETYRHALELLADLELETRGGGAAALSEDTAAVRVVTAIGSR